MDSAVRCNVDRGHRHWCERRRKLGWFGCAGASDYPGHPRGHAGSAPYIATIITIKPPVDPATTTYTYNGDGLRTSQTTGNTTHTYSWDISSSTPLLLSDGSTNYIYDDNGLPIEQIDAADTTLYYQHDQLGSTRLLTDTAGNAVATYRYDAYGNLAEHTGSADTPLRWAGQSQDASTGLYYLRHRYYDPQTGQFLTVDPFVHATGAPYAYATGNPVNAVDPTGDVPDLRLKCCVAGSILLGLLAPPGTEFGQTIIDADQEVAELIEKSQRQGDTVIVSEDDDEIDVTVVDGEDEVEVEVAVEKPSEMSRLSTRDLTMARGMPGSGATHRRHSGCSA